MIFEVLKTREYQEWFISLADERAQALITARVERLQVGNPGNVKAVGNGISELRIDFGPGYRVYFTRTGRTVVLLLCGGDKSTQAKDIRRAKRIAASL
jgi:putative addiction module killer protein